LAGLFRRLGLVEQARAWRAMAAWARAAGPRIAQHARAEQLRNKTLVVRVASSAWANELSFLKAELLAKLQELPGGDAVQDLRFSVGPLGDAPSWDESAAEVRRERRARAPRPTLPAIPAIKDGLEGTTLAQALDEVADPELRASLARLLGRTQG
jgi:predicted nucleic acid-binding Zn ribbon protein